MSTTEGTTMTKAAMTVTDEQIEQLRTEAGQAGDTKQVELCNRALVGDEAARRKCEDAIEYVRGEAEDN